VRGRGDEEDFHTSFDALSYTLGVPGETKHIICDGHDIPITENLFDALRMLQPSGFRTLGRYLLVDSICIDQANDDEKGYQVCNMLIIYQKATQVVAWLGPAADGVGDALTAAASTDYGGGQNLEKICAGLLHFYTRSWFTRMWVQQEIFAARKLRLQCGPYSFWWSRVLSTPTLLWESQHLKPYIDAIRGSEEPPELPSELHSVYQSLIKHIWEASRIGEDTCGYSPQAQYNRTRPHYHYPVWYLIHRKDPQRHGRELCMLLGDGSDPIFPKLNMIHELETAAKSKLNCFRRYIDHGKSTPDFLKFPTKPMSIHD
jgi:hypothetical protein